MNNSQITPININGLSQSPNEVLPPLNTDVSSLTSDSETSILNTGASTSSSQDTVQSVATTSSYNTVEKVIVILILLHVNLISKLVSRNPIFLLVLMRVFLMLIVVEALLTHLPLPPKTLYQLL